MDGVNVTIVPFRLGRRSFLRPVPPGPPPEVDNARTTSN